MSQKVANLSVLFTPFTSFSCVCDRSSGGSLDLFLRVPYSIYICRSISRFILGVGQTSSQVSICRRSHTGFRRVSLFFRIIF